MAKHGFSPRFSFDGRPRLLAERCRQGWSQKELADLLGTTPLNVSRWERGLTRPGPYFRRRLADLFDCDDTALRQLLAPAREHRPASPSYERSDVYAAGAWSDPALPFPAFPSPLVGRAHEITAARERLLSARGGTVVTLLGLPGVGKTALAVELASDPQIRAAFPHGLLWATLGPFPTISTILARWTGLLEGTLHVVDGQPVPEVQTPQLHDLIRSRRLLVVLDDAWYSADVAACLPGGPNCVYLLTTRSPWLARQFSLDEALLVVPPLDEQESLQLVGALVPRGLDLEPEGIRALVRLAGGLPLTLTLIGQYLGQHAYSGQPRRIRAAIAELQHARRRLALSCPRAPLELLPPYDRSAVSLRASIELSERLLSAGARAMLRSLSAFPAWPASFSEEAALALSQGNAEQLDELSDAGLLTNMGPGRYALHRVIADYARIQEENRAVLYQPSCSAG